ncbi:MAG: helix-turn-helix transcriptional regulator [Deltaproteobacteria bacterium]|nr:helix-turn-helix transcriptional regulator [Deltaproteobacteria bacterium]
MNSGKDINTAFSEVLRELRELRGLSQEALAAKSDLDRTYISLLERGQRQPTLKSMSSLANALETTLTEFARQIEYKLNENR